MLYTSLVKQERKTIIDFDEQQDHKKAHAAMETGVYDRIGYNGKIYLVKTRKYFVFECRILD